MAERSTWTDHVGFADEQLALDFTRVQTLMKLQASGQASKRKRGLTAGLISTIEDSEI